MSRTALAWLCLCGLRGEALGFDTLCVGGNSVLHACTPDRPASIQNALGGAQPGDTVLVFPGEYTGGINDDTTDTGAGRYAWWRSASPTQAQPTTAEENVRNVNLRLNKMRSHVALKSLSGPSKTIITCEQLDSGLPLQAVSHRVITGCTHATRCPGSGSDDCSNAPDCAVRGNCAVGCVITSTPAPPRIMDGFGIIAENGETYQTVIEGFTITRCGRTRDGRPGGGLRVLGGTSQRNFPEECSPIDSGNAQHLSFCSQVDLSGLDPGVDQASCENSGGGNICQYYHGAGMTVRNTWFVKNYGSRGAAIYVSQQGHIVLDRVVLRENVAESSGGAIYADVGNFDSLVTNLVISDALIVDNVAGQRGGGISSSLSVASCHIHISNSVIASNTAGQTGGGLDDAFTIGSYRLWNTIVVDNAATVQTASSQIFCGPNVNIISDQPDTTCQIVDPVSGLCEAWLACTKGTGRSEPLQLSAYNTELSPTDANGGVSSVVIGFDKMTAGLEMQVPVQRQLPFFYGVPGQVWYLPPPATESCTGPVSACSTVARTVANVPFTAAQCAAASSSCVYTPNDFRDPVTLTVSGMTLRPFRDMVEVLLIPKSTDSLEDIFDVECYTRQQGEDYRGLQSVSSSGISCVAWDAHSPLEHGWGNTPELNPFDGLEDGAFCRNPDGQAAPWCYLAEPTSSLRLVEACSVGAPVGTCARDLEVMAKFTSNSTWNIFANYDQGMFIRLTLDENFMTEGGLQLTLDYAESCTTAGCSGHGVCDEPEAGAPHVCICHDGYLGVDCSIEPVQYTRIYGSNGRSERASAINLQTALTLSGANDVVRVGAGRYSGDGNYDIALGNVNLTFAGAGPWDTIIDCRSRGRGFYIDSSVAAGAVSVAIEALTVTHCYANDDPARGPLGGAVFVKHTVATFRNVVLRDNRADTQGGAVYGFRSSIRLEDTVIGPGNTAPIGGGLGLESTILVVDRAFVHGNIGTSLTVLDGQHAGNLNCFADSRVEYTRGFHWKKLGSSILELDTCSCCNGCQQAVPPLDVTQVTFDKELQDNITLGELSTKVVVQGTFISFGDDSVATQVYIAGEKCILRNVSSYQIVCGIESPYVEGQSISVRRSDGERADFPDQAGTCEALAASSCAAVDATAATGPEDCPLAGNGACDYVPPGVTTTAACVASDSFACNHAFGSESECLAAGRCMFTAGPDKFKVYPERGVDKHIVAVAPLLKGQTSENNGRTKIILKLMSQPQAIVEIPVVVLYSIPDELLAQNVDEDFVPAVIETPVLYFTPENWREPAQVVVSGVDDKRAHNLSHNFIVQIGPTDSIDINYKDRETFLEPMTNTPFNCLKFGAFGYVPAQVGTNTQCVCDRGYEKDPVMLESDITLSRMDPEVPCVQCSNGKYKPDTGNQECTMCPLSDKGSENYLRIDTANLMGQITVESCVCREGYVYDDSVSSNNTCIPCDELCWDKLSDKKNLRNFDPKKRSTWCSFCDASGVKLSTMTVREGWWRNSTSSRFIFQCPSTTISGAKMHCLEHTGTTSASIGHSCLLGSHGVMCTACDAGYAKVYTARGGCDSCSGTGQQAAMFAMILLLAGFMYWVVHMSIKSADDEDSTSTMLLKIMISFTVTNMEVMKFRSQWPKSIASIFNFQKEINSKTSFSVSDIVQFDCLFQSEPTEVRVWTKLVFFLLLPLLSIALPALGAGPRWLMLKLKSRGMHPKAPEYLAAQAKIETCKEWFFAGIVVILYQVYPSTVNTAAAIFNCINFHFDNKTHLASEETVVCEGEEYEKWNRVALGGLVGFGLGVPIITMVLLQSIMGPILDADGNPKLDENGEVCLKMDDHSTNRKYGFLYGGFREPRIWWEAVVGVRKLLFLLSATLLNSYNTPFRIVVAMVITVTFMALHLVLAPYPDAFKEVGAMESLGMMTVFFTYAAVLLMEESLADSARQTHAGSVFTTTEWVFFYSIIIVNGAFMVTVFGLAIWDIWRKSHRHIQEHGLKASVEMAKQALRDKTKVDQIAKIVASPRELRRNVSGIFGGGNESFRDESRRALGHARQHELRKQKEEARKRDTITLNWKRGFAGAAATARAGRTLALGTSNDSVDRVQQQQAVEASRHAIERAERSSRRRREKMGRQRETSGVGYDTEEVEQLRRQLEAAKQELEKVRKGNVANRLRLGLREDKILQLQMNKGRMPATATMETIDIGDIDEILAAERAGTEADIEHANTQIAKLTAEREKVAGIGGEMKVARRKWETKPDQGQGDTMPAPASEPSLGAEVEVEAEAEAEPEPEPEPEAEPEAEPEPEPEATDASQLVGTKIFYGNQNREAAGRNAKQFLQAVQEVKNQTRKNSELSVRVQQALAKDHSWFTKTSADIGAQGFVLEPTPPPTGAPSMARSSSHASAVFAAGRQASLSGLGIKSDEVTPLSKEAIDQQVGIWERANRDAEVHAMKAKMLMLGRFSAANLASTQRRALDQAAVGPSSEA